MKQFLMLCVVAIALIGAVVSLQPDDSDRRVTPSSVLLPSLSGQINAVNRVQIARGTETTTLIRTDSGWQVDELSYPAKTGRLRELLLSLSEAKVIEPKTANPERYTRLGVQDFDAETETPNTRILITHGSDETGLIIGNGSAQGDYVRVQGQAQSALADTSFVATPDPKRWIQTDLLNISPDALRRVEITPLDGDAYALDNTASGWELENQPEGRELVRSNVSRPTRLLQNLRIETVLPSLETPAVDGWNQAVVTAKSGLVATLEFAQSGDRKLMRVSASAGAASNVGAGEQTDAPSARDVAGTLNAKARGRIFVVQDYKYADATLKRDQLLTPQSAEQ